MKNLTTKLCLTIAVLIGSAEVSWSAFYDCKMNYTDSSVKIIYGSGSNKTHYLSVVDDNGNLVQPNPLILPIYSIGQIIYKGKTQNFYVNKVRTEQDALVGYFKDPLRKNNHTR